MLKIDFALLQTAGNVINHIYILIKNFTRKSYHLTSDEEIPVKFACDTTADVICMFLICGDCCCIRDVPDSTSVII